VVWIKADGMPEPKRLGEERLVVANTWNQKAPLSYLTVKIDVESWVENVNDPNGGDKKVQTLNDYVGRVRPSTDGEYDLYKYDKVPFTRSEMAQTFPQTVKGILFPAENARAFEGNTMQHSRFLYVVDDDDEAADEMVDGMSRQIQQLKRVAEIVRNQHANHKKRSIRGK
jgi:hypothetical protein